MPNFPITYYFKWLIYCLGIIIISIVCILRALVSGRIGDVSNTLNVLPLFHLLSKVLGINWDISGLNFLKNDEPCVIVSNHQTALDILGLFQFWPSSFRCSVVAKSSLRWAIPFGPAAWLSGTTFIDRQNAKQSRACIAEVGRKMRSENFKLFIYPEGTRHKGYQLQPFKKGAFHIALKHKVPIIPVVFGPYNEILDDEKKRFSSGTVKVKILPPIETHAYRDVSVLTNEVRDMMNMEFVKLWEMAYNGKQST